MDHKVGVIRLGYVGLPLAISFSKYFKTIGFDVKKSRATKIKIKVTRVHYTDGSSCN